MKFSIAVIFFVGTVSVSAQSVDVRSQKTSVSKHNLLLNVHNWLDTVRINVCQRAKTGASLQVCKGMRETRALRCTHDATTGNGCAQLTPAVNSPVRVFSQGNCKGVRSGQG